MSRSSRSSIGRHPRLRRRRDHAVEERVERVEGHARGTGLGRHVHRDDGGGGLSVTKNQNALPLVVGEVDELREVGLGVGHGGFSHDGS
jgi:hypothetical protein